MGNQQRAEVWEEGRKSGVPCSPRRDAKRVEWRQPVLARGGAKAFT